MLYAPAPLSLFYWNNGNNLYNSLSRSFCLCVCVFYAAYYIDYDVTVLCGYREREKEKINNKFI